MPYNRTAALDYARYYWNRVCHDGKIGSNWEGSIRAAKRDQGIHATFGHAAPGTIINDQSASISLPPSQVEDDCTHFISCCIGYSGPNAPIGGGLPIGQPYQGNPFGFDNPDGLLNDLIPRHLAVYVGEKFRLAHNNAGVIADAATQLRPGDLVAYADANKKYAHMAIIVAMQTAPASVPSGPTQLLPPLVACHTGSRQRDDFTTIALTYVSL